MYLGLNYWLKPSRLFSFFLSCGVAKRQSAWPPPLFIFRPILITTSEVIFTHTLILKCILRYNNHNVNYNSSSFYKVEAKGENNKWLWREEKLRRLLFWEIIIFFTPFLISLLNSEHINFFLQHVLFFTSHEIYHSQLLLVFNFSKYTFSSLNMLFLKFFRQNKSSAIDPSTF